MHAVTFTILVNTVGVIGSLPETKKYIYIARWGHLYYIINVWLQGKRISVGRLVHVYEAMVVSVIMYNCSSWAVPKVHLDKLDICHRAHLRRILKIKWPNTITNEKLYKVCSTRPLSDRVKEARWKMLGHILRSPEDTPAALALSYAVGRVDHLKGRRGRHKINLLSLIRNDLSRIPVDRFSENIHLHQKLSLNNQCDIDILRNLAHERSMWKRLFYYVAWYTSDYIVLFFT